MIQRAKHYLTPRRFLYAFVALYAVMAVGNYATDGHVLADKYALAVTSILIGWWLGQADVQERARKHLRLKERTHGG